MTNDDLVARAQRVLFQNYRTQPIALVRDAVVEQTKLLWHASNLYVTEPQIRLAEQLTRKTRTLKRAFFCNSGAEANEAMIKLARHFQVVNGHPERIEILCFHNSFHGR